MPDAESQTRSLIKNWVIPVLTAVMLAVLLKATVVQANYVPSGSMMPTLLPGDHMMTSRISYGLRLPFGDTVLLPFGEPQRGDVVVFANPSGKGSDMVKRIMALPGESIEIRNRMVFINGKMIQDPWGRWRKGFTARDFGPVRVPEGSYFMMGDNRDNSFDSRFWRGSRGGFVPRGDIRGKVVCILWSWESFPTSLRLKRSLTFVE